MNPLRRVPALLAAFALAGCQSGQGSPEPAARTPAGQARPASPRDTPPPRPAPASSTVRAELGYLKPTGEGERCQWMRHPLPGEPSTLFTFDAACDRSMVSWSPDGKQGLVFSWPSGEGEVARAWRVDFGSRSGQPLDLKSLPGGAGPSGPDTPYVSRLAFDAQGRPVALVVLAYAARAPKKGVITFEGERYPVTRGPGVPGLALAYRLEGGGWKRVEAKPARFNASSAPGVEVLDTVRALTPTWSASLPTHAQGRKVAPERVGALNAAAQGAEGEGWWMELSSPEGTLYYRAREEGPNVVMGPPLLWARSGAPVALKDVAEPDAYLGFQLQRGLLLVTAYGGYAAAHAWEPAEARRVASVPEVYAPAFWPTP
jgi:hypothetical protein